MVDGRFAVALRHRVDDVRAGVELTCQEVLREGGGFVVRHGGVLSIQRYNPMREFFKISVLSVHNNEKVAMTDGAVVCIMGLVLGMTER